MSAVTNIYISLDTAAVSLGADEVAEALKKGAEEFGRKVNIIRTGSRGMVWLEPLVEIELGDKRLAYGPVTPDDVPSLIKSGFFSGDQHPLALGPTEEIDYFKRQTRLTFAHSGLDNPLDLIAFEKRGGFSGLKKALTMNADDIVEEVAASGLRGRGGAGFPTGIKWRTVAAEKSDLKYIACKDVLSAFFNGGNKISAIKAVSKIFLFYSFTRNPETISRAGGAQLMFDFIQSLLCLLKCVR